MSHQGFLRVWLAGLLFGLWSQAGAAQIASRPADEWVKTLDQPNRVAGLHVAEVIERLRLKPGAVIADIGAGSGAFSTPFGKAVAPGGKVYAVEIDEGFFVHINRRAQADNVKNVQTVAGKFTDPNLPAQDVDLAFFHDVLHHVEDRAGYLKNLARYIKPGGRVAIIEFGAEQGPHREQPEMRLSKEQVTAWMADAGFKPAEEHFDVFADKFFLVYSRQ
jgi:ubiquinone/menaquinone biosynthesis C-methylase UbiE